MVKRLRRRPLTAESGVRFPMRVPKPSVIRRLFYSPPKTNPTENAFGGGPGHYPTENAFGGGPGHYPTKHTFCGGPGHYPTKHTFCGDPEYCRPRNTCAVLSRRLTKLWRKQAAHSRIRSTEAKCKKRRNSHDAVWCHFINLHVQGGSTAAPCFCLPLNEGA